MVEVECSVNVRRNGEIFLNPLKYALLKEISQYGSLRSAAKRLEISYQHAWTMLKEINTKSSEPLVINTRGGVNGGGCELTKYGMQIMMEYNWINQQVNNLVNQINVEINL